MTKARGGSTAGISFVTLLGKFFFYLLQVLYSCALKKYQKALGVSLSDVPRFPDILAYRIVYRGLPNSEHTLPDGASSDGMVQRIRRTNTNTTSMEEGSNQNVTTINWMRNLNTKPNIHRGQEVNVK